MADKPKSRKIRISKEVRDKAGRSAYPPMPCPTCGGPTSKVKIPNTENQGPLMNSVHFCQNCSNGSKSMYN